MTVRSLNPASFSPCSCMSLGTLCVYVSVCVTCVFLPPLKSHWPLMRAPDPSFKSWLWEGLSCRSDGSLYKSCFLPLPCSCFLQIIARLVNSPLGGPWTNLSFWILELEGPYALIFTHPLVQKWSIQEAIAWELKRWLSV